MNVNIEILNSYKMSPANNYIKTLIIFQLLIKPLNCAPTCIVKFWYINVRKKCVVACVGSWIELTKST